MDLGKIAKILYDMSLDMDYADHIDYADEEISCIEKDLELLKKNNCNCLLQALEVIASKNE